MDSNLFPRTDAKVNKRLPLVDALRALAASIIAWHHFALYPPLSDSVMSLSSDLIEWLRTYARATQVFFVVSGFVMARNMSGRSWSLKQAGTVIIQRYYRLGLPYLAAIGFSMTVCSVGRGLLPPELVGSPPTIPQLLAHVVFLQDILGYESLSAGLWFVCINFQLGLIYVAMLCLPGGPADQSGRTASDQATNVHMLAGWTLAIASLFYFNLDTRFDVWATYYFAYFFLGVMVHHGTRGSQTRLSFWLYIALIVAATVFHWRWRLISALVTGLILFLGVRFDVIGRWPKSRLVRYLGTRSYSLFLIHFPVLVAVSTIWVWMDWTTPWAGIAGLTIAYLGSLAAADLFFRTIEAPAARLGKQVRTDLTTIAIPIESCEPVTSAQ